MAKLVDVGSFEDLKQEFSEFVEREKELAKAELAPAVKRTTVGSGMFGGAAIFGLHALWMLLLCGALAVGWLLVSVTDLSPWGAFTFAFLIVAVFSLLVAGILALIGRSQFKKVKAPEATIAEAKATLSALYDSARGRRRQLGVVFEEVEFDEEIVTGA